MNNEELLIDDYAVPLGLAGCKYQCLCMHRVGLLLHKLMGKVKSSQNVV